MTILILVFAFLIEQMRPMSVQNPVFRGIAGLAGWLEETFNAGERAHGRVAWLLMVVPLVVIAAAAGHALSYAHPLLAFGWSVLLLYLTLGFRQFSHHFTNIQLALNAGNLAEAQRVLTLWVRESDPDFSADGLDSNEIVRHTVRQALIASHRHVFGVLFWTMIAGAPGAVLYRLAEYLNRRWNLPADLQGQAFGQFAQRAFQFIDWVPVRLTAIGFAVVGNFEDAVYCWRTQTVHWPHNEPAILLASGQGALGVRLHPVVEVSMPDRPAEMENENEWNGSTPELPTLQAAVGLVWRSVVLWMIVLVLVSIGSWIR